MYFSLKDQEFSVLAFTHEYRRYGYIIETTAGSQLTENRFLLFAFSNGNNTEAWSNFIQSYSIYWNGIYWKVCSLIC